MEGIAALKNNSYDAFNQFYKLWHKRTYYYFLKQTKSESDAKDLTQETFIKIWRYRHNLSLEHTFEVQLFQTAKIVLIDNFRLKIRSERLFENATLPFIKNISSNTSSDINIENKDALNFALQQLPPIRRKVFILYRLYGYSYKEIASELTISVKTVENHLSKALKQLKKLQLIILLILIVQLYN